jgi:hypothetical protein
MNFYKKIKNYVFKKEFEKQFEKWKNIYGEFDGKNYEQYNINNLHNESGFMWGEIVQWCIDLNFKEKRLLLAGDNKDVIPVFKKKTGYEKIYTSGLFNADFIWNFEKNPPTDMGKFAIIISQAILEHLIDPYKHMKDLIFLLEKDGHLIVHTVLPGFTYHRYPVDTVRFFPDWFEEIAKKFQLKIVNKMIKDFHIFYHYKK